VSVVAGSVVGGQWRQPRSGHEGSDAAESRVAGAPGTLDRLLVADPGATRYALADWAEVVPAEFLREALVSSGVALARSGQRHLGG
jgi:hypothetical protein